MIKLLGVTSTVVLALFVGAPGASADPDPDLVSVSNSLDLHTINTIVGLCYGDNCATAPNDDDTRTSRTMKR
ncbi:hypothetical protein [Actinokineospora sp. NBRC 105648]|uniref:hypothetical protein n=1 Tax=Actinokineospora sp. NBRC 105648 TaxID=3032206 RepID=UPI002553842B|nr:hypothetical protein [Actinokineospora sp. NBRC 105648]